MSLVQCLRTTLTQALTYLGPSLNSSIDASTPTHSFFSAFGRLSYGISSGKYYNLTPNAEKTLNHYVRLQVCQREPAALLPSIMNRLVYTEPSLVYVSQNFRVASTPLPSFTLLRQNRRALEKLYSKWFPCVCSLYSGRSYLRLPARGTACRSPTVNPWSICPAIMLWL